MGKTDWGKATFQFRHNRVIAAAIVGGTASKLAGGKFANGAVTAAMVQMFNAENGVEDVQEEAEPHIVSSERHPKSNTVVTDGKGGLKAHLGNVESGTPQIVQDGIRVHENMHIDQILANSPKLGVGHKEGYVVESRVDLVPRMEREAIKFEIKFLRKNMMNPKYAPRYRGAIKVYKQHIKTRIKRLEAYRDSFKQ